MPETTYITSRKNEWIKEISGLVRSAEKRHAQGLFVVEGARLCLDAARSQVPVMALLFTEQAEEKYRAYVQQIREKAQQICCISPSVAELISDTRSPQGIFCLCRMQAGEERGTKKMPDCPGKYLAVENMQDPANLGTVCRTAEALGIAGVILLGECCDFYSPKALRAGMGAAFRLPVFFSSSFADAKLGWEKGGFVTFAAVPARDAQPVTHLSFPEKSIMVIGNEGNGLLPETIAGCEKRVTIPMLGRAESLNAAASASILMWEMMRTAVQEDENDG